MANSEMETFGDLPDREEGIFLVFFGWFDGHSDSYYPIDATIPPQRDMEIRHFLGAWG